MSTVIQCNTCGHTVLIEGPHSLSSTDWTERHHHETPLDRFLDAEDARGQALHGARWVASGARIRAEYEEMLGT